MYLELLGLQRWRKGYTGRPVAPSWPRMACDLGPNIPVKHSTFERV